MQKRNYILVMNNIYNTVKPLLWGQPFYTRKAAGQG